MEKTALIIQSCQMLKQEDLHNIQQDLAKQMAEGVVVIPAGMEVLQLPGDWKACETCQVLPSRELMEKAGLLG